MIDMIEESMVCKDILNPSSSLSPPYLSLHPLSISSTYCCRGWRPSSVLKITLR